LAFTLDQLPARHRAAALAQLNGNNNTNTKRPTPRGRSAAEILLALQCEVLPIRPVEEHRFDTTRKWRFDFAWPDQLLAVEVEGITYGDKGGRHQRGAGFEKDLEKYEAAQLQGWTVYRCSPAMVKSGRAISVITTLLTRLLDC